MTDLLPQRRSPARRWTAGGPPPAPGTIVDDKQINLTWLEGDRVDAELIDCSTVIDDRTIVNYAEMLYRGLYGRHEQLEVVVDIGRAEIVDVAGVLWLAPLDSRELAVFNIATHCPTAAGVRHTGSIRPEARCPHCGYQPAVDPDDLRPWWTVPGIRAALRRARGGRR